MKISMFAAVLVPGDWESDRLMAGDTVELTYGGAPVMEWSISVNVARCLAADETEIDRFIAGKFRDLFTKVDNLPNE